MPKDSNSPHTQVFFRITEKERNFLNELAVRYITSASEVLRKILILVGDSTKPWVNQ